MFLGNFGSKGSRKRVGASKCALDPVSKTDWYQVLEAVLLQANPKVFFHTRFPRLIADKFPFKGILQLYVYVNT